MFPSDFVLSCNVDQGHSIYLVHDDNKEKEFELEMSWVGDETNDLHVPVPADLLAEAEQKAREALETFE